MRYARTTGAVLLALGLMLSTGVATTGCTAEQVMTDAQKAEVALLDQEAADARADASAAEAVAERAARDAARAMAAGDEASLLMATQTFQAAQSMWTERKESFEAVLEERDALVKEALSSKVSPISGIASGIISAVIPGAAPFAGLIDSLTLPLAALFFKRPRRRLLDMGKHIVKGQLGDVIRDAMKYVGFQHSNDDPLMVLRGARAAAMEKGDTTLVASIDALLATFPTPA